MFERKTSEVKMRKERTGARSLAEAGAAHPRPSPTLPTSDGLARGWRDPGGQEDPQRGPLQAEDTPGFSIPEGPLLPKHRKQQWNKPALRAPQSRSGVTADTPRGGQGCRGVLPARVAASVVDLSPPIRRTGFTRAPEGQTTCPSP